MQGRCQRVLAAVGAVKHDGFVVAHTIEATRISSRRYRALVELSVLLRVCDKADANPGARQIFVVQPSSPALVECVCTVPKSRLEAGRQADRIRFDLQFGSLHQLFGIAAQSNRSECV